MTTDPGTTDSITRDADGRIAEDVLCLTCGYNLRSRTADDACPECGSAVSETFDAMLINADATWLLHVQRAAWVMLGSSMLLRGWDDLPSWHWSDSLWWLLSAVFVIAAWRFTAPRFGLSENRHVRAALVLWVVSLTMVQVARMWAPDQPFWTIVWFNLTVFHAIAICLLLYHGARMARLLPAQRLASRARFVMWGYAAVQVLVLLISTLAALVVSSATLMPTATATGWIIVSVAVGVLHMVFTIWAWILLLKLALRLRAITRDRRLAADHSL